MEKRLCFDEGFVFAKFSVDGILTFITALDLLLDHPLECITMATVSSIKTTNEDQRFMASATLICV